jgi:hypothetical protein
MLIFTLVDEGTMMMDACGTHTRALDNHHSHDGDQRNTERFTSRGRSGRYFSGKMLRTLGVFGGSASGR